VWLVCWPVPALSLCYFMSKSLAPCPTPESSELRVQLLAPPTESSALYPTLVFWGRFSVLSPSPMSVLDYSSLFMIFSFGRGWVQSAHRLSWITFQGMGWGQVGREAAHGL
jgi:hypothetical protein